MIGVVTISGVKSRAFCFTLDTHGQVSSKLARNNYLLQKSHHCHILQILAFPSTLRFLQHPVMTSHFNVFLITL
jgi:hypothetical protein